MKKLEQYKNSNCVISMTIMLKIFLLIFIINGSIYSTVNAQRDPALYYLPLRFKVSDDDTSYYNRLGRWDPNIPSYEAIINERIRDPLHSALFSPHSRDLELRSLTGVIDLEGTGVRNIDLKLHYSPNRSLAFPLYLRMGGGDVARIQPGIPFAPDSVSFSANYLYGGIPGSLQRLRVPLFLEANSRLILADVEEVAIDIRLPSSCKDVIFCNQELIYRGADPSTHQHVYQYNASNCVLSDLQITYVVGLPTLRINKEIVGGIIGHQGPVTIKIAVENVGPGIARDIRLTDKYDPVLFEQIGSDFHLLRSPENDEHLIWTTIIPFLDENKGTTITYQVHAKSEYHQIWISPTAARLNGMLVGQSRMIWIP